MTKIRIQAHSRSWSNSIEVTDVTPRAGKLVLVLLCAGVLCAQQPSPPREPGPAESLYLKLRSVGLDKTKIYKIREAALDRGSAHFSFDDGTIGFTEDAGGHVTGAFFTGFGEVLLSPPNTTERTSMAFFTGAAILEEKFSTAYLRFNDDLLAELGPSLRAPEDAETFYSAWNMTARNLADQDALRLLLTLSESTETNLGGDRFLHAYLRGEKLGTFDVRYDSLSSEPIAAGQHRRIAGQDYYDVWTSFAAPGAHPSDEAGQSSEVESPAPGFEVTATKINAEIRPPTQVSAKAVLSVIARQGGKRALFFELSRLLEVKEVRADGEPVEFIHNQAVEGSQLSRRGNDVIAVILPQALNPGQKIELRFDYAGAVISEAANGLLYVGERGTWYPNRGMEMTSFDMEFRYPPGWTLVATGIRTENRSDGGQQVSRWTSERPVPVAGFNLGKYSATVTRAGTASIVTYATGMVERSLQSAVSQGSARPNIFKDPRSNRGLPLVSSPNLSPSQNLQSVGMRSARALEFFEHNFGPFPYSLLSITQMPGTLSQGWPGLIFLSSYSFLTADEQASLEIDAARRLRADQIIAHETAHQWWGDLVTWKSYRDQWICEALANYSALMLLESHDPAKFRTVMQTYRDDLLAKDRTGLRLMDAGPVTLGLRLSSSRLPGGYEAISYGRGTWLIHMVRSMMRDAERKSAKVTAKHPTDEPFIRALRKLRGKYEGRAVSTAELLAVFESELPPSLVYDGHKSLNWFLRGWITGSAIPELSLKGLKFSDKEGGTVVTGSLVQEDAPGDLVTAVPIYAVIRGRSVFAGQVFAEGTESPFRLTVPAGARRIVADPEQTLLSRKK
jgi:hypothetical protein